MFYDELIRYEDIKHHCIIENVRADSEVSGAKRLFLNDLWSEAWMQYGTMPVWSGVATPRHEVDEGFFLQIDLANGSQMVCRIPNSTVASNTVPFQWRYLEEKLQKIVDENQRNNENTQ